MSRFVLRVLIMVGAALVAPLALVAIETFDSGIISLAVVAVWMTPAAMMLAALGLMLVASGAALLVLRRLRVP